MCQGFWRKSDIDRKNMEIFPPMTLAVDTSTFDHKIYLRGVCTGLLPPLLAILRVSKLWCFSLDDIMEILNQKYENSLCLLRRRRRRIGTLWWIWADREWDHRQEEADDSPKTWEGEVFFYLWYSITFIFYAPGHDICLAMVQSLSPFKRWVINKTNIFVSLPFNANSFSLESFQLFCFT